jgi:hypothetical protein
MPKYRLLNTDELQELEKEFVEFLVINGITASDWERLKANDPQGTHRLIVLFSDVVFESILQKVKYLEKRGKNFLRIFQCLNEEIVLVGLETEDSDEVDFTNPVFVSSAMLTPPQNMRIYTSTKAYSKEKNVELFEMIQNGCTITDDRLFKTICLAL